MFDQQSVSYREGFCKVWTAVACSRWIAVDVVDPGKAGGSSKKKNPDVNEPDEQADDRLSCGQGARIALARHEGRAPPVWKLKEL